MSLRARLAAAARTTRAHLAAHPLHLGLVTLAAVAGAGVGWPVSDDAFTYLWADDRFCNDCHVHDYANDAYARSAHAGLTTCHDCHMVPIAHYPRNLWVTVVDPPQGPEDIHTPHVDDRICESCHAASGADQIITGPMPDALRAQVLKIDDSPLHRVHLAAALPDGSAPTCMSCHGSAHNRAHRFRTDTAVCLTCHLDQAPAAHADEGLACRDCHYSGFSGTVAPP